MIEDTIKVTKGDGLPLGVRKVGRCQWQFSIAKDKEEEISLHLFHKGEQEPVYCIVLGKEHLVGGIYSVIVTIPDKDICEYVYVIKGEERLDPYARQIAGREIFGQETEKKAHCCMVEEGKPISEPLERSFHDLILYRLHVRGFTMHESSKIKSKGTFKGVEEKISHMKQLGINGVMLMPCYDFEEQMEENTLSMKGIGFLDFTRPITTEAKEKKVNFWGYTKRACYFAPKASFAANPKKPIEEMKHMVKKLHENGIAVFMEIFFTPGTNQTLILDCLRYWVRVYGIDGFKINDEVVPGERIVTDPFLSRTKFLATTWNTRGIYEQYEVVEDKILAEYNDGFMVDCRRFLKSDEGQTNAFLERMRKNSTQQAVVNYISNTNGFTLMDMVSYDIKHNEANGENSQDGTEYNYSWNCGWEGPTRKKQVTQLRLRQIKNALIMVFLSQGVPMILAGDEFGNTQFGNNNAYCQDNEIGWVIWSKQVMNQRILAFTKKLIALRKEHPVFSSRNGLRGMDYIACGCPDISVHGTKPWYPDLSNYSRVIGVMLYGKYAPVSIRKSDKTYYIAYNMHWEEHTFSLPLLPKDKKWKVIIDTQEVDFEPVKKESKKNSKRKKDEGILEYVVKPRTIVVFEGLE